MPEPLYLKVFIFMSVFNRPIKSKLVVCCCCLLRVSCPLSSFCFNESVFVFLNQNICCGYSKDGLNETVLLNTQTCLVEK